jgi:hypothetical protein
MVRTMNPTELRAAKGDFVRELENRATGKIDRIDTLLGRSLLNEVDNNRAVLKAAGFNADDIGRIERVGRSLQVMQARSAAAGVELISDDVGTVMRLLASIAGSRAGTRILKIFGGATGAGPSLILAQFGSRVMRERLGALTKDKAEALIRAALRGERTADGKDVFEALLVKPTDNIAKQADAARTIQAWLIGAGAEAADSTTEEE